MEFDIANQFERLVALFQANPGTSFFVLFAILLILGFQKDGVFSRALALLEAKSVREVAKEERRIEIMRMLERRNQLLLPGIGSDNEESPQ